MTADDLQLREAISSIAELARKALGDGDSSTQGQDQAPGKGCTLRLCLTAYSSARQSSQYDSTRLMHLGSLRPRSSVGPKATILVSKWWGARPRQLSVSSRRADSSDLRSRTMSPLQLVERRRYLC